MVMKNTNFGEITDDTTIMQNTNFGKINNDYLAILNLFSASFEQAKPQQLNP